MGGWVGGGVEYMLRLIVASCFNPNIVSNKQTVEHFEGNRRRETFVFSAIIV